MLSIPARRLSPLVVLMLVVLTAGCAGLGKKMEQPRVTLAGLTVVDFQLFEQRYGLTLRVQNPNDFELPVRGLSYRLEINDREFAHGVSRPSVTIPPFGEELIQVEMVSNILSIFEQLRDLEGGSPDTLRYRLSGKVSLGGGLLGVPFEHKGELGGLPGADKPDPSI